MAALAQHPELQAKIKNVVWLHLLTLPVLVSRVLHNIAKLIIRLIFQQLKLAVPTCLLISENDPWLSFSDAQVLAQAWQLTPINLGQVGHINVASGFGAFPEIYDHLIAENMQSYISISDNNKYLFKFAI